MNLNRKQLRRLIESILAEGPDVRSPGTGGGSQRIRTAYKNAEQVKKRLQVHGEGPSGAPFVEFTDFVADEIEKAKNLQSVEDYKKMIKLIDKKHYDLFM